MTSTKSLRPTAYIIEESNRPTDIVGALLLQAELPVRAFSNFANFATFYRPQMTGCLVVDLGRSAREGFERYRRVMADEMRLPTLFIASSADVNTAVRAMKAGAFEFLLRPLGSEHLIACVRDAMAADQRRRQAEAEFVDITSRLEKLNPRDRETLDLLLAGSPNKVIASRLLLSERAVEMRRARIMRKLGVQSLAELIHLAVTHRVLSRQRSAQDQRLSG